MSNRDKYEGYYADCYVLTSSRTRAFINSFLDKFIPQRQESTNEYEIPQYSERPTIIYTKADELIDYLVEHKNEVHTIYWNNEEESELKGAMCFFTNDGQLITGLYCETMSSGTAVEDRYFKELKEFCNSTLGYIAYEDPAPHNTSEFLEKCQNTNAQHQASRNGS